MPEEWNDPKKKWKIGAYLETSDEIFGGISLDDILLVLRTSVKTEDLTPKTVLKVTREILNMHLDDFWFIVQNNLEEMIEIVKKEKEGL